MRKISLLIFVSAYLLTGNSKAQTLSIHISSLLTPLLKDKGTMHHQSFVNKITGGDKCNSFGHDVYVQNADATAAYTVTIKVVYFKPGVGSKESQKVVAVPAGGKTYLGCSIGVEASVSYTYTVIGESRQ